MHLLELVFTPRCVFCQRILGVGAEERVCPWCHPEKYYIKEPRCRRCGRPVSAEGSLCRDCLLHRSAVSGRSLYAYDGIVRDSIHRFKYESRRGYGSYYAEALWKREGDYIRSVSADMLVPVPLHAKRLRQRGYNQASVVAGELSRLTGIPWKELLVRTRVTAPQKGLGYGMRTQNIAGAFAVAERETVPDSILLIDDIYTTGSTVEACGKALLEKHPQVRLHFLTIAAKIFD